MFVALVFGFADLCCVVCFGTRVLVLLIVVVLLLIVVWILMSLVLDVGD